MLAMLQSAGAREGDAPAMVFDTELNQIVGGQHFAGIARQFGYTSCLVGIARAVVRRVAAVVHHDAAA
jgi:hypothetical protein